MKFKAVILMDKNMSKTNDDMNGCNSQIAPTRLQHDLIYHSKGNVSWANSFTRECQYIKQENIVDDGCDGCGEKEKK